MIPQCPRNVCIGLRGSVRNNACRPGFGPTARRSAFLCRRCSATRCLSTLSHSTAYRKASIGHGVLRATSNATSSARRQSYATTSNDNREPRQIAVLGAGITGLTTAHYLARYAKDAHITIYEASDKPGGWIKATQVEVEDREGSPGHVLFQHGPRVLRSGSKSSKYDDLVLYDVLASLGLDHKIRHPQAVSDNRYIYYPDHLVKMPSWDFSIANIIGTIRSLLIEPIWSGLFPSVFRFMTSRTNNNRLEPGNGESERDTSETYRALTSKDVPDDESVARFLTRIMKDDRIVNNVVSGVMHGIYGGDVHKLSAKHTMLDGLWNGVVNPPPHGGLTWSDRKEDYLMRDMLNGPQKLKIIELAEGAVDWKLLAFEDGLISLVNGLMDDLKSRKNVTFKFNHPVVSLKHQNSKILVTTSKAEQPVKYDHAICTLFSKQLAKITEPPNSLPSLAETHAVTIMVVNLWYPNTELLDVSGFGYLVPSSTPDNHECVLGVLFDSDLRTGDDDNSEPPGTKLTVMLGGHHWDGWKHLPSEEMGIAMAKEVLQRHLGISTSERAVVAAHLCRECLPQHFVGHRDRMKHAHYELILTFKGHLTVAGPSYTSIGVIPAMRAGFDAAMRVARGHKQPWFRIPENERIDMPTSEPEHGYLDYWDNLSGPGAEKVTDVIGTTGLKQFSEDEWAGRDLVDYNSLLFRHHTARLLRFKDPEGNFVRAEDRPVKNAPMTDPWSLNRWLRRKWKPE